MKTVYLAGAILGCSDEECRGWRQYVVRMLGNKYRFLDPMRRDYRGIEQASVREIVENDLKDIDESDVVLADCSRNSSGTSMEVFYAFRNGKKVITFGSKSPWVLYHSTYHADSLANALKALEADQ